MRYETLKHKTREFLAMTGYTVEEFVNLLPYFQEAFDEYMSLYTFDGFRRENRRYVPYRNSPLPTIEDKLLFILSYLKQQPTQTAQGLSFGMGQAKAQRWIHLLHQVLHQALDAAAALPARDTVVVAPDSTPVLWQDGTERPIPRPSDPWQEESYYSGKKNA